MAGKYAEAAIEYKNAIQIDPKLAQGHYDLAECYLKQANWRGAYEELGRTIGLEPNNRKAQIALGNLYLASGRFLDARSSAQTALKGDSQNVEAQVLLSDADAGLKDFRKAVPEAQSAIGMNPNLAASYTNLGGIEEANQNNAAAEQNFKKATQLDSKSLPAILALGSLYAREKRWLEAEKQFQAAIAVNPQNQMARADMAEVYLSQGRKDAAEHALKDAKEALKDTRSGYRMLGDYYIAVGENDKALAEFASLYSNYPRDTSVAKTYVQLLILQNRLDEATKIDNTILKASPSDTDALVLRGADLGQSGQVVRRPSSARRMQWRMPRTMRPRTITSGWLMRKPESLERQNPNGVRQQISAQDG